ncbi:MAG: hypothetical protein ABI690_05960 [Chloroflexota bacterium]
MLINLDVVDILQLQEIWSRRPVVTAFTRLETRQTELPCAVDFNVDQLLPRLARLKHSPVWRVSKANLTNDPARIPMRDLSDEYLNELYPEADSAAAMRQKLFSSAYNRFVIAHYNAEVAQTCQLLHHLAHVRNFVPEQCLDTDMLPQQGSPEWIPADITDEVRNLDERYDQSKPGLPATYIIADRFWALFVKATAEELEESVRLACPGDDISCLEMGKQAMEALAQVAYAWNRSPSVVGLCYQVFS